MEKFTKGRWEARVCDAPTKTALVYISNRGGIDISGAPDCIGNAYLMAAAPDMYEFIKSLQLDCADDIKRNGLLAKARGEHE